MFAALVSFGIAIQSRLCCGEWLYSIPAVLGIAGAYAGWLVGVLVYGAVRR